uniref:Protein kinase domain-containing protein n=1 Tax=Spongospora subterranea TaxID=70186 RepID=A0A0H5R910_9EUKA|eukprot:CRZ10613.1 hypothetical protein [Spongospora subterranea]
MSPFFAKLWRWLSALFAQRPIYRLQRQTVKFINPIAEGGFAFVDLVENCQTRQRFALKRILCGSEDQLKVAREEVSLLSRMRHPNIIQLVDSSEFRDGNSGQTSVLLLTSLHSKGSLLSDLAHRKTACQWYTERELLRVFLAICQGVSYLHYELQPPVAHRDIKPGNVLLDDKVGAVLTDFGSASAPSVSVSSRSDATRLQEDASRHSTITYRAPELIHVKANSVITPKTDVWSLGCLLYAMCYGISPLDEVLESGGSIALAVVDLHVRHSPIGRYSPAVHSLIDSMLQCNPKDRPSVKQLVKSVSAALANAQDSVTLIVD